MFDSKFVVVSHGYHFSAFLLYSSKSSTSGTPGAEIVQVIELQAYKKVIDHNLALDIAALNIEAREVVALVGPMGSGKTHLLKLLIGRSRPTVGTLRLAGIDPRQDKDQFSRRAGVLFAQDSLYKRQSSRAGEALAQVGLADHASAKVDKLPPGLVRRAYDLPLEPLDTPTNCFRAHRVAW